MPAIPPLSSHDYPHAKRESVNYLYNYLNWDFLKCMAEIACYAEGKYGAAEQYTESRLIRDRSPMNHIAEHVRQYLAEEKHDHFGDMEHQLAAIAYNAQMEYYYYKKHGHLGNPFKVEELG